MLKRIHPRRVKTLLSNAGDRVLRPHTLITAGKTPYDVVKDDGLVRLRHYRNAGQGAPRYATPLDIVPPLAINMLIYDWFPQRSFSRRAAFFCLCDGGGDDVGIVLKVDAPHFLKRTY